MILNHNDDLLPHRGDAPRRVGRLNTSSAAVRNINGLTGSLSLEPLPPAIYQRRQRDATADVLGLADRIGLRIVCLLPQAWANQADDECHVAGD